jgi:hypothetical protein
MEVVRVSEVYSVSIFRVEVSAMSIQQIHRGRMGVWYRVQTNSNSGQLNVIEEGPFKDFRVNESSRQLVFPSDYQHSVT